MDSPRIAAWRGMTTARPHDTEPSLVGTVIGQYRITAALSSGGMGEVYRALDTRLDRDVAIKVLPSAVASDPDRLARFEREAKALASINHPHIATVFGFEESRRAQHSSWNSSMTRIRRNHRCKGTQ